MSLVERLAEKVKAAEPFVIGDTVATFDSSEDVGEEMLAKAERELRETPEVVQESFKVLCDMLGEEEDLYVPLELEFLQKFLRRCKWYPKSAYKLMKRHYEYRANHPEFFADLVPSNEKTCLLSGAIQPVTRRTMDGCRVLVIETGLWNPKEFTLNELFRGVLLILELATAEPMTQIAGVRVIIDFNISLSHVAYFKPSFAFAVVDFVQRALHSRLKGIHIICTQTWVFNLVFAFFKPFLNGKIREKIHFHGTDKTSILSYFGPRCLPKKYGGDNETETENYGEKMYKHAVLYDDYFIEVGKYGYAKNT